MAAPSGVPRDPRQPTRSRLGAALDSEIFSSLMRSGQLVRTANGAWQIPGTGGTAATGANVSRSTSQTIGNSATTAISFDTSVHDDGTFWNVSAPTKLVIPTTGWYLFTAHMKYNSNGTGKRVMDFRFNGTTFPGASISWPGSGQDQDMALCLAYYMTAADYVEVTTFQNSGGDLDVTAAEAQVVKL